MLVEDTAAFIEQLEVLEADRRARKRCRRVTRAEVEVMRAELEARLADDALRRLAGDSSSLASSRMRMENAPSSAS
jgi:hypothetical protein